MGLFRDVGDPDVQSIRRIDDKTVRVKYREEGAGVDHEGISITIDDHPVNYRWLESEGWIELAIPRNTSLSSRTLKVEIKDRAGRRTVVRKRIKNL